MLFVRSVILNVVFYIWTAILILVCMLTLPFPRKYLMGVARFWGTTMPRIFVAIMGGSFEIRGRENLPKEGGFILAPKHQSAFETFALLPLVRDPLFILKRELLWIPGFGLCILKGEMVAIDRGARSQALKDMMAQARERMKDDRQLIIFPEGTRTSVDAEPHYKYGIAHIYKNLDVPCVPVALNTGLFWPRRTFMRHGGKILIEVLPPIEPSLEPDVFFETLSTSIETASNKLIEEARQKNPKLRKSNAA